MSVEPIRCVYCNAEFEAGEAGTRHGRRLCPRCGEPLPEGAAATPLPWNGRTLLTTGPRDGTPQGERVPLRFIQRLAVVSAIVFLVSVGLRLIASPDSRAYKTAPFLIGVGGIGLTATGWLLFFRLPRSNQAILRFLLANSALAAGLGISYALLSTPLRRQNDPREVPVLPTSPAQLAALGYLPADSRLVAGIHVGELLAQPAGQQFLSSPEWGPMELALKHVERWTGLKRESIDHIALGVRESTEIPLFHSLLFPGERGGLPRSLTIAVQTRRKYRADSPPEVLKHLPASELHGRPLYRFQPKGLQGLVAQGFVWCAGDKTLVLTLWWDGSSQQAMTEALPAVPRAGTRALDKPLQNLIEGKLSAGEKQKADTPLWIAVQAPSRRTTAALLPFPALRKTMPEELSRVRGLVLGLSIGEDHVSLQGEIDCIGAANVRALAETLERQTLPDVGTPKVVTSLPNANEQAVQSASILGLFQQPLAALAAASPQASQSHWITFQLRSSPEAMFRVLRGEGKAAILPRMN